MILISITGLETDLVKEDLNMASFFNQMAGRKIQAAFNRYACTPDKLLRGLFGIQVPDLVRDGQQK